MNIKKLETAAALYSRSVSAENTVSGDNDTEKSTYFRYCEENGLDRRSVELYHQVCFFYQRELPAAIHAAELDVMRTYTNKLAKYYDDKGESSKATALMEIAAQLEV